MTDLIGRFQRSVKIYARIYFIGPGPTYLCNSIGGVGTWSNEEAAPNDGREADEDPGEDGHGHGE